VRRDELQAALADARAAVEARTAELAALADAAQDSNADDEHDPEGHTLAFERQQVAALRSAAQERVSALEAALEREAAGDDGRCAVCGGPIGAERLAARPHATTCVACASIRR
jgi:DnaK suppressor protein